MCVCVCVCVLCCVVCGVRLSDLPVFPSRLLWMRACEILSSILSGFSWNYGVVVSAHHSSNWPTFMSDFHS